MNSENNKELGKIWHALGTLLNTGVSLLHSLKIVRKQTHDPRLQQILDDWIAGISSGCTFHQAAAKFPDVVPAAALAKIKAGEAMGLIDETLLELADASGAAEARDIEAENPAAAAEVCAIVSQVLLEAIRDRASDLHFEWNREKKLRVRIRVDGVLKPAAAPIPDEYAALVIRRIKIMAGMNLKETRLPQDGRIRVKADEKDIDLRVAVSPCLFGELVCMRILDRAIALPTLDQIFTAAETLATLRSWIKRPSGLIIASGPAGSGKTTLLLAMLQEMNSPNVKINTIEDPVEYAMDGINQQPVNPALGLTFGQAIRAQFRQASDIMMVGETRDLETAELEIRAALTGQLVLTALHTTDAPEVITRLLDIGVEPFLASSVLIGAVAQRLVRTICGHCREEYKPESWILELLGAHRPAKFFRGKGCPQCNQTGFRGRIAIQELLELNDPLRLLINRRAATDEFRRQAIASGMVTLKADGLAKVARGLTTVEEVLRACP